VGLEEAFLLLTADHTDGVNTLNGESSDRDGRELQ
jgi:hypothetical protein